jgi:glycine/D-amino acid oxidase-like deaminating enzyme
MQKFETSHHICGAISHIAGALSPYKLITIILSSLLRDFKSRFFIETNTPVTHITTFENASRRYQVHTPRGTILTNKIIHATNGHGAYLVPGLEGKLIPARAQMSAQYPSEKFEHTQGSRSWCFFGEKSLEYITQRPSTAGELMLGGGFRRTGMDEIGIADDGSLNLIIGAYLGGFLSMVFGNINESTQAGGKLAAMWTGILGITLDVLPFVGPLDEDLTQRKIPESRGSTNPQNRVGEWIAVGYNGEGMVNAWLCGVAVSLMALGLEDEDQDAGPGLPKGKVDDWLPSQYLLTQERLSRASIYDLGELL